MHSLTNASKATLVPRALYAGVKKMNQVPRNDFMIKSIWKDPVWSKVIAAGILAVFASLGTYLFGVWPTIGSVLAGFWDFLISNTSVPNWLIGLMIIPCAIVALVLLALTKERIAGETKELYDWRLYRKDEFFGLLWAWQYSGNRIDNLHSLCPRCEYQVIPKDASSYAAVPRFECSCDDCGYSAGSFEGQPINLLGRVELKIQKNVRTGEWAKRINA